MVIAGHLVDMEKGRSVLRKNLLKKDLMIENLLKRQQIGTHLLEEEIALQDRMILQELLEREESQYQEVSLITSQKDTLARQKEIHTRKIPQLEDTILHFSASKEDRSKRSLSREPQKQMIEKQMKDQQEEKEGKT